MPDSKEGSPGAGAAGGAKEPPAAPGAKGDDYKIGDFQGSGNTVQQNSNNTQTNIGTQINVQSGPAAADIAAEVAKALGKMGPGGFGPDQFYGYPQGIYHGPSPQGAGSPASTQPTKLPETQEELEQWYYGLTVSERCFVQAAAVLIGAPVDDISWAAYQLYEPILRARKARAGDANYYLAEEASLKSSELYARTHTVVHRVDHTPRLYWQVDDEEKNKDFPLLVLHFVVNEAQSIKGLSVAPPGEGFLDQVERWPDEFINKNDECSWRAARALGTIWHERGPARLESQANRWAENDDKQYWEYAASLLAGAYEAEQYDQRSNDEAARSSDVLRILDEWVELSSIGKQCAAASAYRLIGRESREIALDGLEKLFQFSEEQLNEGEVSLPRDVFIGVARGYLTLARIGSLRQVLGRLGAISQRFAQNRNLAREKKNFKAIDYQRWVGLHVAFVAFLVIADESSAAVKKNVRATYSLTAPLPENPKLPDDQGRDVLLAGLLTKAEAAWRQSITRLLCAELLEKEHKLALDQMRKWADLVLQIPGSQGELAEKAYEEFLVDVGWTLKLWSDKLFKAGFTMPRAVQIYKSGLERWQAEGDNRESSNGESSERAFRLRHLAWRVLSNLGV